MLEKKDHQFFKLFIVVCMCMYVGYAGASVHVFVKQMSQEHLQFANIKFLLLHVYQKAGQGYIYLKSSLTRGSVDQ